MSRSTSFLCWWHTAPVYRRIGTAVLWCCKKPFGVVLFFFDQWRQFQLNFKLEGALNDIWYWKAEEMAKNKTKEIGRKMDPHFSYCEVTHFLWSKCNFTTYFIPKNATGWILSRWIAVITQIIYSKWTEVFSELHISFLRNASLSMNLPLPFPN